LHARETDTPSSACPGRGIPDTRPPRVGKPLWTNNPEIYEAGYLPNAVLIFPGVGRIDRSTAVNAIRGENRKGHAWAEVKFEEARVVEVGAGVALLTYKPAVPHADAREHTVEWHGPA
jgi:hypothetical protein